MCVDLIEFVHQNDYVHTGRNVDVGAGDSDSGIITVVPLPPPTPTTEIQKECVDISTYSGQRGARGVCKFSSRTAPKGTGHL